MQCGAAQFSMTWCFVAKSSVVRLTHMYYFSFLLLLFFNVQIIDAVKSGVNVVIWFAVNLVLDKTTGLPSVQGT